MRRRTTCLAFIVLASVPACRGASPLTPSVMEVPPAGEYTLQISEAQPQSDSIVVFACLTISPPGSAVITPINPGPFTLRILIDTLGDEAVGRLPSASGANGGDLRLTFMRAVRGTVSGTVNGRATAADGRSSFYVDRGTLTGTAADDWRRASGRMQGASMSFAAGGTSCGSSEAAWQLSQSR